jgi:hypothetical protein
MLLDLLTTSHLPFLFVEYQKFCNLFSYARLAPTPPSFPSRKVIREHLRGFVLEYQQKTLQQLLSSAKLLFVFDYWTSPF